jgi:Carboxypeptidase regulatory-like domain/TonB dependent receptor/TonB-dependent Receptor Plug Domain
MGNVQRILALLIAAAVLVPSTGVYAQVTTATLYGIVRDSTGAVLPGANVTATNQGTNLSREIVTDERGEFALPALPTGAYTLRIALQGFKTYTNQGLALGAGQTVRQTFVLEVGQVSENITVAASAPLVDTASTTQVEALGSDQVRELPVARRNIGDLLVLSAGVNASDKGEGSNTNMGVKFRVNGVGDGGSSVTVDGTNAAANPENRGFGQYGAENQIDIMGLDAVAEVQIVKGILPAEYGGTVGGVVNLLTRSGTNVFHGSLFENHQNEAFFARDPFLLPTTPKPSVKFNQFGGSLGGPIVPSRAHFFATYEGYRETTGVTVQGTVPTQQLRDQILAALPFPETKISLDQSPLPNQPINANIGRFTDAKERTRRDNHILAKGDVVVLNGNLSVTISRFRPRAVVPSFYNGNDQNFRNASNRATTQYVLARRSWVSESRFGWNNAILERAQDFWFTPPAAGPAGTELTRPDRRMSNFSVSGLFGTAAAEVLDMRTHSFNLDQKLIRLMGAHNLKVGFRWMREGGNKTNPEAARLAYQTLGDLFANVPNSAIVLYGQPPHYIRLDQWGGFIQDDWRVNNKLMLNLGLRYDYYPVTRFRPTTDIPAEIINLNPPSDLRKMDFGAPRPQDSIYEPARLNFGPRLGLAWSLDEERKTVIRGGVGVLYSPHLLALFQNVVSDPQVPARVNWNRTEIAARNIKWPIYSDELRNVVLRDSGGAARLYGIIDTNLRNPRTVQSMIDVQRAIGSTWMAAASYVHTAGRDFPLSRIFQMAFDRATGARPNPALGNPSGYYIDSSQTMVYDGFEGNIRKSFSNNWEFSFHYTLSKGWAQQGGDLTGNFARGNPDTWSTTQDFWDPNADRDWAPLSDEVRHRVTAQAIYELPWFREGRGALSQILGGWQISGVLNARTGLPLRIAQLSGIPDSRPDYVGGNPVLPDWHDTLLYLNPAAFARVPTYPATNATIRPGTQNPSQVRGPGRRTVNIAVAKTIRVKESMTLQVRAEAFNALNHVNYRPPNTSILSPDFGKITAAAEPRTGQIGVRLTF